MCDFMLDTIASSQRGNLCVSSTFLKSRKVCSVRIDWIAPADLIGTGSLLQIQSLFIPHEDLKSSSKGLKAAARGPHCVSSQIKPLYYYHEKHVTLDERRK